MTEKLFKFKSHEFRNHIREKILFLLVCIIYAFFHGKMVITLVILGLNLVIMMVKFTRMSLDIMILFYWIFSTIASM